VKADVDHRRSNAASPALAKIGWLMLHRLPRRQRSRSTSAVERKARNARAYRLRSGDPVIGIRVRPIVFDALIAQGIDSGLAESAAEAESRNRVRVAVLLDEILTQWGERYLAERKRHR
jgi:hypothetical protein